MGLFNRIFGKKAATQAANGYFETLTAYTPTFRTWGGALYESELVRSAIDARARHISKLQVQINGSAQPQLRTKLQHAPNEFQTWSQWLYRLSTILDMQNTAFVVPVFDKWQRITGYFPVLPSRCEFVDVDGEPWIRYHFSTGVTGAVEMQMCGIMTKYQYKDDFIGEPNSALNETMKLINMQNQGIEEAVKNSNTYRFMAQMTNFSKDSDMRKERQRFSKENFQGDGGGGLLLFPNNYKDIKQISQTSYTVDNAEMQFIRTNIYNYFGVNEKILQNSAMGDELDAFFNGAIEPFAIQLSDVMTKAMFTQMERSNGNSFVATANRLQYMSTTAKISMAKELGDRGDLMIDEIRELFNYPPLPDGVGQVAPIRGEFKQVTSLTDNTDTTQEASEDGSQGQN